MSVTSRGWRLRISRQASLEKYAALKVQSERFISVFFMLREKMPLKWVKDIGAFCTALTEKARSKHFRAGQKIDLRFGLTESDEDSFAASALEELNRLKVSLWTLLQFLVLPNAAVPDAIVIFWVNETKAIPPLEYRPQISPNAPAL